ncbi:CubicO group peptidase, beta-lactamase class C family [Flaviramulus basaltis]|uniref:CubicO group peptidase, beta-lactamase class C family n=1 Tax=Flaviramulus basaltis TaxID=369401 RepID=A0A1K2IJR4_9FLAO|nr:serine hydrolase [Flaviramulus basaltis]SFZ92631.1 CubicO group peptidase, beta-lactamase class C family [Flaviramulus basaltis]
MKKLLFTSLFFFLITLVQAQNLESKIDQLLEAKYKPNEPGATALVYKNGKVIYRKAFGNSNLELDVPMKPENIFEIGSITKQFTSVSILMLVEQGKLNLDDEITKFIPDYPTHGKTITIHHLLTHTSGIKSYTSMNLMKIARTDMSPTELIDYFKNEPMDFDPGESYRYNNSGYILLGYIIEKISGKSYADFIDENIFKKLGMYSSHYGSNKTIIKNRAYGYQNQNNTYTNADYISLTLPYAAGSLMSNVDDMLKWQQAVNSNTLISKSSLEKAYTNYTLNNGEKLNYGYGWSLNAINDIPTIEHGGGIFGYTTMGVNVPSKNVYVIVLTNCDCNSPTDLAIKIAALAIGKPYSETENTISLTNSQLQQWVGNYEFEDGALRSVTLEDDQLFSQRDGSSKFKIFPISANEFSFDNSLSKYVFSINNDKKEVVFKNRIDISKGFETDKKVQSEKESIEFDAAILKQYIGVYTLQPGFNIEITTEENKIFAQATGQSRFEIFGEGTDKFFFKVVVASIKFIKDENDKVKSLILYQGGQEMEAKKN